MKKLIELETDEEFKELEEILSKVSNGQIVATLRQAVPNPNGTFNSLDVQQVVANTASLVQINDEYIYFTLRNLNRVDVRKVHNLWNIVLQRGTQRFTQGLENDYWLTVDVVHHDEKEGIMYLISGVQPVFASSDNSTDLTLVFGINNVRCNKETVSVYELDYEIALREESENEVYDFEDEDDLVENGYDENNELLDNADVLSND